MNMVVRVEAMSQVTCVVSTGGNTSSKSQKSGVPNEDASGTPGIN